MKRYLATSALITQIGILLALVSPISFASPIARPQEQRIVVRRPWRGKEPVSIVNVKTKNRASVELGKEFDEADDWLEGFTVTVSNNYHKTVTAMTINMVFGREPGDPRPPVAKELHFGPSPIAREYVYRNPNRVIKVGKTADLRLNSPHYKNLKRGFEQTGYSSIKKVELVITEVGFEDGSVFDSGTFYLQDPAYPNDPTKKVQMREQSKTQNHKFASRTALREQAQAFTFVKAFLTSRNGPQLPLMNSPQPVECFEKGMSNRTPEC